jgi:putative transposase
VFPITTMCSMLEVSRAGYYAWVGRPPSAHAAEDEQLAVRVREIHELTRKRYGAPRVQRELAKAQDIHVSQKRVARLMRQGGLRARPRRRFKCTTMSDHDQPVAANLLDRNFEAAAPDQKWVGDTTELITGNGKLFLAVILDLYSRFVVGWALCSTTPTRAAPMPARTTRGSSPGAASSAA